MISRLISHYDHKMISSAGRRKNMIEYVVMNITGKLVINNNVRLWCKLPYPNHPKGCPNYGNKVGCPPKVCKIDKLFDLNRKHWLAIIKFDLKTHKDRMRLKHPNWSDKQLACCLYWQGKVKKNQRQICKKFMYEHPGTIYNLIPEALGVHVFKTVRPLGIPIERHITNTVYKIALIGYQI